MKILQENGQYGIEGLTSAIDAANSVYDLVDVVYLDDKKFTSDDLIDLVGQGPTTIQKIVKAANLAKQFDEEITDLSEAEKEALQAKAGEWLKSPGYQKILKGVLEMVDGISELQNPNNPTS